MKSHNHISDDSERDKCHIKLQRKNTWGENKKVLTPSPASLFLLFPDLHVLGERPEGEHIGKCTCISTPKIMQMSLCLSAECEYRFPLIFHPADEDLRGDQNRLAVLFLFVNSLNHYFLQKAPVFWLIIPKLLILPHQNCFHP